MEALTSLIREDATQSMPPFDLWLAGRDDILTWWFGPGNGCRGSRVIPVQSANGAPAFGQYKPAESGEGYEPWALQVRRDRERSDRRAHVLPRRRDALPALRPSARLRRLAEHVREAHELDEFEKRLRCVSQPDAAAASQAASCRRASASTVTASGSTPADVADDGLAALARIDADAVAQAGEVRGRYRAANGERDLGRPEPGASPIDVSRAKNSAVERDARPNRVDRGRGSAVRDR